MLWYLIGAYLCVSVGTAIGAMMASQDETELGEVE